MHSVRKPWWQQATALVTVSTGGVITGFNFVPGAAATMTTPTSVPLHLLALEQAAQPGTFTDLAVGGDRVVPMHEPHLSILLARDHGFQHVASTEPKRVTRHRCQLDVRILKHLLHTVRNTIPFSNESNALSVQLTQFSNRSFRDEAAFQ